MVGEATCWQRERSMLPTDERHDNNGNGDVHGEGNCGSGGSGDGGDDNGNDINNDDEGGGNNYPCKFFLLLNFAEYVP